MSLFDVLFGTPLASHLSEKEVIFRARGEASATRKVLLRASSERRSRLLQARRRPVVCRGEPGLFFLRYANPALKARGIAVADSTSLLRNSTLRENYFLSDLAECIDTPMVATRVERNEFGQNGGSIGPRHRHIHSLSPGLVPYGGDNWIVGNVFRSACCEIAPGPGQSTESVYFQSRVPLHIIGNNFETNYTDTALRIQMQGVYQVIIEGNWFEGNHGLTQMTFLGPAIYPVRLENNWYSMYGRQKKPDGTYTGIDCDLKTSVGNCYIFKTDPGQSGGGLPRVYMGYEAGQNFTSTTELTANPGFLTVTGPLCLKKYSGTQAGSYRLDCN